MAAFATALVRDTINPEKSEQSVDFWTHISKGITDESIMRSASRAQEEASAGQKAASAGQGAKADLSSPHEFLRTFNNNFDTFDSDNDGVVLRKELESATKTNLTPEAKEVARVVLEHFDDISEMGNNTDVLAGKEPWNFRHPFSSAISKHDLKGLGFSMSPKIMKEGPLGARLNGFGRGVGEVVDGFAASSIGSTVAWGGAIAYLAGLTKVGTYGVVGGGLMLAYGLYKMQKPAWALQSTQRGLDSNFKEIESWGYFDFDRMWREDPPYERPGSPARGRPSNETPLMPRGFGPEKQHNQQPERKPSPGSWQSSGMSRSTLSI